MKILENVDTVFNDNLVFLLRKYLEEKVRRGEVIWEDAYNLLLDQTTSGLIDSLKLQLQQHNGRIKTKDINRDLAIAKIFLAALELESKNIDRILGNHELLRKDTVRTITDIQRRYLDIVNHSIQEFRTTNVEIRDGKIRLFPLINKVFFPNIVDSSYQPETFVKKIGNDPTPENLLPGTNKGQWETTIFTKNQGDCEAKVVLDFINTISFNRLKINSVGKFPVTLTDIEAYINNEYVSIHTGDVTSKFINVVYPQTYQTSKIRVTLTQTSSEYTWWTVTDNKELLVDDDRRETAIDECSRVSIEDLKYTPIVEERIDNVYSYTIGAYNILVFLDIYGGNVEGKFYSRKFTAEEPIETIRLSSDIIETKPGVSSIIYNIIQQDGSKIPISPGETVTLTKTFQSTQTLRNGKSNWVELTSAPLASQIVATVNGEEAALVKEFTGSGALEYIINNKKLFFNVSVEGQSVSVTYYHKTDYFIMEILLNNNTNENQFETPTLENFGVIINGIS